MNKHELTRKIKYKAYELGFAKVGFAPAEDFTEYAEEFESRLEDYKFLLGGEIDPLKGSRLKEFMPEGKSIIALVWDYSGTAYPEKLSNSFGRAYLSQSYLPKDDMIHGARLKLFVDYLESLGLNVAKNLHMPERYACAKAGVITYGKNNFAYAKDCGSFIILRAFLVDQELEYDESTVRCDCPPNCHACIDSCPTGALYAPGKLKPQKCFLFSHMRGKYYPEVRALAGAKIHGCDECQTSCPRNQKVLKRATRKNPFLELLAEEFDLEKVLLMDQDYYERVIYPIGYNYITKKEVFQRNAAVALGNTKDKRYVPSLIRALKTGKSNVQGCAAWALGNIGGSEAYKALTEMLLDETIDSRVKDEVEQALKSFSDQAAMDTSS